MPPCFFFPDKICVVFEMILKLRRIDHSFPDLIKKGKMQKPKKKIKKKCFEFKKKRTKNN